MRQFEITAMIVLGEAFSPQDVIVFQHISSARLFVIACLSEYFSSESISSFLREPLVFS